MRFLCLSSCVSRLPPVSFYRYAVSPERREKLRLLLVRADDDADEPLVATKRAGGVCHFL